MITAGSLFSGIGGMDLAFSLAGFDIRWQVEIDDFCRKVLQKHSWEYWRDATQFTDVRRVTARSGKGWKRGYQQIERVDVLFGGFPCQDISIAGDGAGIREGTRSGLWSEFRRLIGEIRPRAVLLENVPNIVHLGGIDVTAQLAALGYDARWGIISAEDAGAPHVRERWWCIAVGNTDCKRPNSTGNTERLGYHSHKEWHDTTHKFGGENTFSLVGTAGEMGNTNSQRCENIGIVPIKGEQRNTVNKGYAATRLTSGRDAPQSRMGRNTDGLPNRMDGTRLMALEYPAAPNQAQHAWEAPRVAPKDRYTNARLKACGNAVVPQVVYPIALELFRLLTSDSD